MSSTGATVQCFTEKIPLLEGLEKSAWRSNSLHAQPWWQEAEDSACSGPYNWRPGCPSEPRHIHLLFCINVLKTLDSFSCEVQRRQPTPRHQEQTCDQKIKWDNKKNKSRKKMQWLSLDFLMTESAMQILPETAGSWKRLPLLLDFSLCLYEGTNLEKGMRSTLWFMSAEQTKGRKGREGPVLFDFHSRGGILCTEP